MTHMNLSRKQKQTHRHRKKIPWHIENRLVIAKGRGGMDWSLGLVDANYYI